MPTDQPSAQRLADRRMAIGLLLSLLAHALILSIGFGLPGMRAGGAGPITVSLAPVPPPTALPEVLSAPADAAPAASPVSAPVPVPVPAPAPASGFRLFDPVPMAPPSPPPQAHTKPGRRRRSVPLKKAPARETSSTPVIVQQDNPDAAFKVPLADTRVEPVPEVPELANAEPEAAEPGPDLRAAEEAAENARAQRQREADEEAQRMARLREEAERQRLAEDEQARAAERAQEQRLAEERASALQRQAQAEQEQARLRDEAAARERLLASEREARLQQEQQLRQERDRQERVAQEAVRAAELAAQRALAEEQARDAAVREAGRLAAEETTRRLAAERERARRQRAEQAAAQATQEELARQQAIQQARRQAHEAAETERARQVAQGKGAAGMPASSAESGAGPGGGDTLPHGSSRAPLDGAGLSSRARELLRGIELPATPPAALRPAQQMAEGRRRVVDTLERDVPLRLYVDSFRQKIERNAAQIRMQVAGGPGRADPLVSVALRSDGSVDDVTIVRSSGRADLDEAVRRIVRLNARYAAFPPNVAARFDVIEIRRIWLFAENLKLVEEVR